MIKIYEDENTPFKQQPTIDSTIRLAACLSLIFQARVAPAFPRQRSS